MTLATITVGLVGWFIIAICAVAWFAARLPPRED
jgi:hypothetical protein